MALAVDGDTADVLDRVKGALVGLALGDALGTTLEFEWRDALPPVTDIVGGGPFGLAPGEWTDDTSMALCLADSLLAASGLDPGDLIERFCRWYEHGYNSVTGECFDIGDYHCRCTAILPRHRGAAERQHRSRQRGQRFADAPGAGGDPLVA